MSISSNDAFLSEFMALTPEQRQVLLQQARNGDTALRGTPGKDLMEFVGLISSEDLELMKAAIEEGCEQVDTHGW